MLLHRKRAKATEHEGQSETDSQSQSSDGSSSALVVAYRKPAQVRPLVRSYRQLGLPDTLDQNGRRFYSKTRFWFPLGIMRGCQSFFFFLVVPRLLTYVVSRDCLGSRIRGTIYSTRSFLGVFGGVRPVSTAPDRPFAGTGRVEQVD